jgi:hypothetical protein
MHSIPLITRCVARPLGRALGTKVDLTGIEVAELARIGKAL